VVFTRDTDGAASQVLGVATDISEARLVAEERATAMRDLHALAQRLEQNNRELQEFAYVASHDLQEPLRKIVAFGDRLRSNYGAQLEDQGLDYLNRMQRASRRMQSLVQDLLALSRITTRGQAFHRVDLTQVVAEVLSDLEVTIEETQAEVEVVNLMTIDADPTQIRQLFQNLLSNALKFRVAERRPRIQVQGQTTSMVFPGSSQIVEACQITISDNGIGFDPKYAQRIFDVFQRLHARNEYDGTGIGLAICRRIVERHSGVISADSAPGEGARFTVVMPRHTRRVIDESI
jgi:light-regulated signal transduction histidine kinase (bacteriophytochrome)